MSVGIAITTYRNPYRLQMLLDNMLWSGLPDVPVYVFQDPSPYGDVQETTTYYEQILTRYPFVKKFETAERWGCMQGSIQFALERTKEDWIIYVPDDVAFTRGGLWNEYAGVLTYGRNYIGAIQAPYWNLHDLNWGLTDKDQIWSPGFLEKVERNPHWDGRGVPRKYINVNGAGFSINRKLWSDMGGWPWCTWRLDEYVGFMGWKLGYAIITLPGPPRVHLFGGSTGAMPQMMPKFDSVDAWQKATGGTPEQTGEWSREKMRLIPESVVPDGCFNDILEYFRAKASG